MNTAAVRFTNAGGSISILFQPNPWIQFNQVRLLVPPFEFPLHWTQSKFSESEDFLNFWHMFNIYWFIFFFKQLSADLTVAPYSTVWSSTWAIWSRSRSNAKVNWFSNRLPSCPRCWLCSWLSAPDFEVYHQVIYITVPLSFLSIYCVFMRFQSTLKSTTKSVL